MESRTPYSKSFILAVCVLGLPSIAISQSPRNVDSLKAAWTHKIQMRANPQGRFRWFNELQRSPTQAEDKRIDVSPVYELPFAAQRNTIELNIENRSAATVTQLKVKMGETPDWLGFDRIEQVIGRLEAGVNQSVGFEFSIDKSAPVRQETRVKFIIATPQGEQWTKEIRIAVNLPQSFELFQNYPNPFNPATTISYELPWDTRVNLRIYDLLGRQVATLVDGQKTAGHHQETWVATRFSSGMYVYQLSYVDPNGNRQSYCKRMLLNK